MVVNLDVVVLCKDLHESFALYTPLRVVIAPITSSLQKSTRFQRINV